MKGRRQHIKDTHLHITLRHGEAAFGLSRLREDESGVGRKPPERTPAVRNEQEHRNE
jgi:hypothetical protein